VARTEKVPKLRRTAVHDLSVMHGAKNADVLASLYGSETDAGVRKSIVEGLYMQKNAKGLVDLARKETDPAMKREIVGRLASMKSKEATDYMMELLK